MRHIKKDNPIWKKAIDGTITKKFFSENGINKFQIKTISAPEFITKLGSDAISNCYQLRKADFPGVTIVGEYSFRYNFKLRTVNMSNVVTIEHETFRDNYNLKKLNLKKPSSSYV